MPPELAAVGSVMLGFTGGWSIPGAGGLAGGILGASVSLAISPLSPLDPGLKQAIGWAYMAYGVFKAIQGMKTPQPGCGEEYVGNFKNARDLARNDGLWGDSTFSDIMSDSKLQNELDSVLQKAMDEGVEYGGWIRKGENGYLFEEWDRGVQGFVRPSSPPDANVVALFHVHPHSGITPPLAGTWIPWSPSVGDFNVLEWASLKINNNILGIIKYAGGQFPQGTAIFNTFGEWSNTLFGDRTILYNFRFSR